MFTSRSFSQPNSYRSLDSIRRLDALPELTSQVFSSDAGDQLAHQGPAWYRLLEIIAAHDLAIIKDSELHSHISHDHGTSKSGTFGSVTTMPWTPTKTGISEMIAMKRFNFPKEKTQIPSELQSKHTAMVRNVLFEIDIMGRCSHENIVKLRGILFEEIAEGFVCPALAMEAADSLCPDLEIWYQMNDRDTTMNPPRVIDIATGIAKGLGSLHCLGVVHADLKPTNVLMFKQDNNWQPKLSDFGLSGITISSDAPRGGTHRWNAPECLPSTSPDLETYSVQPYRDIYSFGLLLVYMLRSGRELFEDYEGDVDKMKLDEKDAMADFAWSQIPPGDCKTKTFMNITRSTLRRNPKDRIPRAEMIASLLIKPPSKSSIFSGIWPVRDSARPIESLPTFIPFGNISVSREHRRAELAGSMTWTELNTVIGDNGDLPTPFKKALVEESQGLIRDLNVSFTDIPMGLRLMGIVAMSKEELDSLGVSRPEIQEFRNDINGNLTQTMANETSQGNAFVLPPCLISVALRMHGAPGNSPGKHTTCDNLVPAFEITEVHRAAYGSNHRALARLLKQDQALARECNNTLFWTPLHSAILAKDRRSVKILLEAGADINASLGPKSPFRFPPLHLAYSCEGDAVLRLLLANDQLLARSRDARRRTPLHRAAAAKNLASVKLLLNYGVDINATDTARITPLHKAYAAANGFQGQQELASKGSGSRANPGSDTSLQASLSLMMDALSLALGSSQLGRNGVAYLSSQKGRQVVQYLLDHGADPEAEAGNYYSPECYAYRPSDLVWSKTLNLNTQLEFEPQLACTKAPALYIRAFKGNFSFWSWIPFVLPCPKGVELTCLGGRLPPDPEGVPIADYDMMLEVWMYPPNYQEAKMTTRLLWLLISVRSEAPPDAVVGHLVFSGFNIDGTTSLRPESNGQPANATSTTCTEISELQTDVYMPYPRTMEGVPCFDAYFGPKERSYFESLLLDAIHEII
ncbi:serine threonine kinase [Fusarium beomiforme]|uniref:Serine threonine kinase n=1 Tax=Fusarium beomiforme TaxID=44412 RepID=A0A9P5AQ80_9HYPO|nr:serine threonine kinase [Fusarium beomiforme]